MSAPVISSITPVVHCVSGLGSNWVILQDRDRCTLIDSGYPGDLEGLKFSLETLGLQTSSIEAILITHGHADHIGTLRSLLAVNKIPVFAAEAEISNINGSTRSQVSVEDIRKHQDDPLVARWFEHAVHVANGLADVSIENVAPLPTTGQLDLPGQPQPISTPGHSPGHTSYFIEPAGVLVSGDALVTGHPISQTIGLQMLHPMFHADLPQALSQLGQLADLNPNFIAPGHGPAQPTSSNDIRQLANTLEDVD